MSWYFFGRVLRVGDGPVGPGGEPLRVLLHPRVVGRGLEGEVERDLDAELVRPRHEVVEVLEGAELGVDRVVAALVGADRPRRPGVALLGHEGVVGALAVDLADRVDRREVQHVEAHRGDRVEPLGRGAEAARDDLAGVAVDIGPLAAGEELVPGAVERAGTVDVQLVRALGRDEVAQRVALEDVVDRARDGRGVAHVGRTAGVLHRLDGVLDRATVVAACAAACLRREVLQHPLEQQHALGEHQLDVHADRDLDLRGMAPGGDRVGPSLDRERPRALAVRSDLGPPQVGDLGVLGHAHPRPALAVGVREHHVSAQLVVALAEDQGGHLERLTHHSLGGVAAEVDHRGDVHDGNSSNHAPNLSDRQHLCK